MRFWDDYYYIVRLTTDGQINRLNGVCKLGEEMW